MESISYFNALLADPNITMLHILQMQRSVELARVYMPLRLAEERQPGYDTSLDDEESIETAGADFRTFWIA
jgi:hypothetical protein